MTALGLALLSAVFDFLVTVIAVYIGATLALRGFFGREYRSRDGEADDSER